MIVPKKPCFIRLSNAYALLPAFSADPPDPTVSNRTAPHATKTAAIPSKFKRKAAKRYLARQLKRQVNAEEDTVIDEYITWTEDERTALAKWDTANPKFAAIEHAHEHFTTQQTTQQTSITQQSKNWGYNLCTKAKRALQNVLATRPHVRFADKAQICTFHSANEAIMLTYDSGADGNYISETDRQKAGLPILRPSKKRVGVANGNVSTGNNVTSLPIPHLDAKDTEADTFDNFPHSLMSVGQTSDACLKLVLAVSEYVWKPLRIPT